MPVQMVGDGVNISFDDLGNGRAVVFLHGVMMSRQFFKHQLSLLSQTLPHLGA